MTAGSPASGARDTGAPDARLARALAGDPGQPGDRAAVLAALLEARVFATVTATATGLERAATTGLPAEAGAELAVVLLALPDGSRALPVFSDLLALRSWRADARPVPLTGRQACSAAAEQGAEAVVIDPGSRLFALEPGEVRALAAGWVAVPGSALASRRTTELLAPASAAPAALLDALRRAVAPERLQAARLLDGPDGPVLGVAPRRPLPPAALAALAQRVRQRLGADLPGAGLDLAVVPPSGPGLDVLPGRLRRFRDRRGRDVRW